MSSLFTYRNRCVNIYRNRYVDIYRNSNENINQYEKSDDEMNESKKKPGRPKGESDALSPAKRMAMSRKRTKIYKEECKNVGVVVGVPYCVDKQLLNVFELMAKKCTDTSVEDLLFLAMKEFLIKTDLDEVTGQKAFSDEADLNDLKSHQSRFKLARINTMKRLHLEKLFDPRIKGEFHE